MSGFQGISKIIIPLECIQKAYKLEAYITDFHFDKLGKLAGSDSFKRISSALLDSLFCWRLFDINLLISFLKRMAIMRIQIGHINIATAQINSGNV